jgi:hypothetical protein
MLVLNIGESTRLEAPASMLRKSIIAIAFFVP